MHRSHGGRKPALIVDGYSESVWKSLAVKALRIGWPEGIRQAAARLGKSKLDYQLLCGLFEDVFPAAGELDQVRAEIKAGDYEALCARETHHGRGWSEAFCDLEEGAVAAARNRERIWAEARRLRLWLPARANNTFWTWLRLAPADAGVTRPIDTTPWRGMPAAMLDRHTLEGRKHGYTILSGDYDTHRAIGRRVMVEGWDGLRREAHEDVVVVADERQLGLDL